MTQFIHPFKKSDLDQDTVRDMLGQTRTGIESGGFAVTNGTSNPTTSFAIDLASGTAWVNGTRIYDDETRADLALITTTPPAGADVHWIIYGSHTPADTDPAPPMIIAASSATPPTIPTLPADSVKFADVFVPSGANGISDCRIVQAPPLPDRGVNDSEIIPERLSQSNANFLFSGGGEFSYDGGTDTLTWTTAIDIVAQTITNKEKFQSTPLSAYQIAAGSRTLAGDNSVFFAVIDRLTPGAIGTPTVTTMRVLDLDSPDATEAGAFYDTSREKIVFLGMTVGGALRMRAGTGGALPDVVAPADPPPKFLRMDPGGIHYWASSNDTDLVGGFQIVTWSDATYVDAPTALLTEVPAGQRVTNMIVRSHETNNGSLQEWIYNGAAFVPWNPANTVGPPQGVVSGLGITKTTATQDVVVAAGEFFTGGRRTVLHDAVTIDASLLADDTYILYWDDSAGTVTTSATPLADPDDMPIAVIVVATSVVTKIVDVRRTSRDNSTHDALTCGGDGAAFKAEFTHLSQAMLHATCIDDDVAHPKDFLVLDDYVFAPETMQGTVDVDNTSAIVTGSGTSFRSDFDAGDFIVVGSQYAEVSVKPVSDTSLTLTGNWPGSTLTGQVLLRDTTRGPNSQTVDMRRAEWGFGLLGLLGSEIRGASGDKDRALIQWGIAGQTGAAPMFAFPSNTATFFSLQIKDLAVEFRANDDAGDDELAFFVNAPRSSMVENCRFSGGALGGVTHIAAWTGGSTVDFGGGGEVNEDIEEGATIFRRCVFMNSFDVATNEAFYIINTPSASAFQVTGVLTFDHCSMDWGETNASGELISIDAQTQVLLITRTVQINLLDCQMNIAGSLYRVQESTGTDIHPAQDVLRINIRGGSLSGDAGCDINPISGAGNVFAHNLTLAAGTIDLRGMARAVDVTSVNATAVTLPEQCLAVGCDFESDGTLTLADGGPALIDALAAKMLGGLGIGLAADGTRKSHIIHGCELLADINKEGVGVGDDFGPRAQLAPGALMFPNGLSHVLTAAITFNFHSAIATATKAENIAGVTPTTFPDGTAGVGGSTTVRPFFYVFARKKAGDTSVVLRYDTTKPDVYGRPAAVGGAESAAGYAVDDYAFVGTLVAWDALGTDCTQANAAIAGLVWGHGGFVQHLGPGVRRFGISDAGISGSNYRTLGSATTLTFGVSGTVTMLDTGSVNADIGHCRHGEFSVDMQIFETGAAPAGFRITASDIALSGGISSNESRREALVGTCLLTGGASDTATMTFTNTEGAGSSDVNFNTTTAFSSFTEDRNNLDRQTLDVDWPA